MGEKIPTVNDSSNNTDISLPLVTVNILSYNRRDELRHTLTKVFEQDYKNIEVIVVDNASTDGSAEMVQKEFPNVILIRMEKNIGIAGWNEGFKIAKGEYVLVLDDDSYPSQQALLQGLEQIVNRKDVGIVAFNVYNTRINKFESISITTAPKLFIGCGALISKFLLETIGYFSELIFIYNHELEFSARCYDAGFKILFIPNCIIYHTQTLKGREDKSSDPFTSGFRYYHHFISFTVFLILHFDLRNAIFYNFKWLVNRLIVAIRFNYYSFFLKAIIFILRNYKKIIIARKPLKLVVQMFYENGNVPLIDRMHFPNYKKDASV